MPFALGLIEIIGFSVLLIALAIGTAFDRRGREEGKWYIVAVGLIIVAVYYWSDFTFAEIWKAIRTWGFWEPVMYFFGIGLVYSCLEFALYIRRKARQYKTEWQNHLACTEAVPVFDENGKQRIEVQKNGRGEEFERAVQRHRPYSEVYDDVAAKGASSSLYNKAIGLSAEFVSRYRFRNEIIEIQVNPQSKVDVEPVVNRGELADHICAWTSLWPGYAISLVFGDLLAEVWSALASVFAKISGQFVRISFSNVFKF